MLIQFQKIKIFSDDFIQTGLMSRYEPTLVKHVLRLHITKSALLQSFAVTLSSGRKNVRVLLLPMNKSLSFAMHEPKNYPLSQIARS
jgi:hypothetical protein